MRDRVPDLRSRGRGSAILHRSVSEYRR